MKIKLFLSALLFSSLFYGQNGINTTTPQAALDIFSTNDGLLIPRVALSAANLATPLTLPTVSEVVYNTATSGTFPNEVSPGFYYWNGTAWISLEDNWKLRGNAGTIAGVDFIGTTDNQDIVFKRNNVAAGRLAVANTSFGLEALQNNTTGGDNTGIGFEALGENTSGTDNTAVGNISLRANTTGSRNTSIGNGALPLNTTGNSNTAVGNNALLNNETGFANTGIGISALLSMKHGQFNVGVGPVALSGNFDGNSNTGIGAYALSNSRGNNNTAVGVNSLELLNSVNSTNVGNENTAMGDRSLRNITSGNNNTAFGTKALFNSQTGDNNIGIGYEAFVPNTFGSNQVRIGNTAITYAGIQVAWTITSDRRWKDNIETSDLGLKFINDLRPVSYIRKNDESKKLEYGFIAQELEDTLAKYDVSNSGIITKDDEGMLSVRYNDLLAPMVKAIQELKAENEKLKAYYNWSEGEIKEIHASNEMLTSRLEKLEQLLMIATK